MHTTLSPVTLATLPALGSPWPGPTGDNGDETASTTSPGVFAGLTTTPEGQHCALVLLLDKPEATGNDQHRLNWQDAMTWAESLGASLPTRAEAALLFATSRSLFEPRWHWTCEQCASYGAWYQDFDFGSQYTYFKDYEGSARAVRRFVLSA